MVKKIALEEHFLSPGLIEYWRPTMTEVPPESGERFFRCLTDFGELRLQGMDRAGIARAVLSIAGPGVQVERDAATAISKARESNDFLAARNRRSGPTAIRASRTCRCRTPRPRPTSSSAACASSNSAAP